MKPITFPNLGLELDINPVAFNIFERDIYWYGIIIVSGIILTLFLAWKNRDTYGITWDIFTDFAFIAIPVGIICARIYYVVFQWGYYKDHLTEIINLRKGGLAIYGGIIAAVITLIVFAKKKKMSFFMAFFFMRCYNIYKIRASVVKIHKKIYYFVEW